MARSRTQVYAVLLATPVIYIRFALVFSCNVRASIRMGLFPLAGNPRSGDPRIGEKLMTTIREWLNIKGFDWPTGSIIYQETADGHYPGWQDPLNSYKITSKHHILDKPFNSGFGGPECPRFFARDKEAVYFPSQYDGSTRCVRVAIDPDYYLIPGNETSYPGG